MGLLNIFSKWKITCIILSPVQKDSELVSLFIQYKTMIIPLAHCSLRGPCWTTSTENCLDGFNTKVTFFVIKTWLCRNLCTGLGCCRLGCCKLGYCGSELPIPGLDADRQFWRGAEQLCRQNSHLEEFRLFISIFLFYVSGFGECDLSAMGSMCLQPSIPGKAGPACKGWRLGCNTWAGLSLLRNG